MNDVSDYADYVIVCEKGTVKTGTPEEVFADAAWLQEKLGLPSDCSVCRKAKSKRIPNRRRPNLKL